MSGETRIQQVVSQNFAAIRSLLQECSTESVVGTCMWKSINGGLHSQLSSPSKQISLLLGILLESDESDCARDFTERDWTNIIESLEKLVRVYMELYLPTAGELAAQSESWKKKRQVAMAAFLHYHNQGILASTEQIGKRIKSYLAPFDEQLSDSLGISASEALEISLYIGDQLQTKLDELQRNLRSTHSPAYCGADLSQMLASLGKVSLENLIERYGSRGKTFWDLFGVRRGDGPAFHYPTERSIVETKPLICLSSSEAMVPNFNTLVSAVFVEAEEVLRKGPVRDKYFKSRDGIVENHAAAAFSRVLGGEITMYKNVFEKPTSQFEHDLVIVAEDMVLFVETKATPPVEPFRDPEKAFVRLRRSFRADTGLQKAYEQSLRLLHSLRVGDLRLYDQNGSEVVRIPRRMSRSAFSVCVTRDSFGPLATFLSLLLSKETSDSYPWAVNLLDLDQIADAWEQFGWGERQLRAFLKHRIALHDRVFGDDELDFVAAYIRHCGLQHFLGDEYDHLTIDPMGSLMFDDIYRHRNHGQPLEPIKLENPVMYDLGASLRSGRSVSIDAPKKKTIRVSRNARCPCGSLLKFKRCHGRII